jgi:hypothetical protein
MSATPITNVSQAVGTLVNPVEGIGSAPSRISEEARR